MHVQSIQANQTTNNCRKPCFKAYFVNDAKGNFKNLWKTATFDKATEQRIYSLASNHVDHALEIIETRNGYSSVGQGFDKDTVFGCFYKTLNHYTGKISEYFTSSKEEKQLYDIVGAILIDKNIFKDDSVAKSYRLLTGQKKPRIEI